MWCLKIHTYAREWTQSSLFFLCFCFIPFSPGDTGTEKRHIVNTDWYGCISHNLCNQPLNLFNCIVPLLSTQIYTRQLYKYIAAYINPKTVKRSSNQSAFCRRYQLFLMRHIKAGSSPEKKSSLRNNFQC